MLQGVLFLAGVAAFCLVVYWVVSNDKPGATGGSQGLFAMKDSGDFAGNGKSRGARWRRGRSKGEATPD